MLPVIYIYIYIYNIYIRTKNEKETNQKKLKKESRIFVENLTECENVLG